MILIHSVTCTRTEVESPKLSGVGTGEGEEKEVILQCQV